MGIYDYEDLIYQTSLDYGEDPEMMLNLGQVESAGNPYARSGAGAQGLYQMMPKTAASMGVSDPYDPMESITGGIGYFDKMNDRYQNPALADIAYNWGPGNLNRLMTSEGTNDPSDLYGSLPDETKGHLYKVLHPSSDPENDKWLTMPLNKIPDWSEGKTISPSVYADTAMAQARLPGAVDPRLPDDVDAARAAISGSEGAMNTAGASKGPSPISLYRQNDLSRVTQEITAIEDQKREALQAMNKEGSLGTNDALAIALTAIVPTLLGWGFGGGLQGAAMGAQAGAAGAGLGLQGLQAEMTKKDAANKLLYEDAKTRLAAKMTEQKAAREGLIDRVAKEMDTSSAEDRRDARTGMTAKAIQGTKPEPGGIPLSKEARKSIQGYAAISAAGKDVIDFIATKTPELRNEKYLKPDGSIDYTGAADIFATRLKGLAGPESDIGRVKQKIDQFLSAYQREMSGLAATDKEFERLRGQLYEKGMLDGQLLPTSIPIAMEVIQDFVKKQRTMAINTVQIERAANAGSEEAVGQLFDQYSTTPGAGIKPTLKTAKVGDKITNSQGRFQKQSNGQWLQIPAAAEDEEEEE